MNLELLDQGRECPGPLGGRWHDRVAIDGKEWKRGDAFHVLDRHGAPRPVKFMYHYTGNGSTVCYSVQRFRLPSGGGFVPNGFVDMVPAELAVKMSATELRVRQLIGDLRDVGLEAAADVLAEAMESGDADDIHDAERVARNALAAHDDSMDDE